MELRYKYEQDGNFLFGWLEDYPEHPTQGVDINDLENHLLEIYEWIKDGTLEVKQHAGLLEVAGENRIYRNAPDNYTLINLKRFVKPLPRAR